MLSAILTALGVVGAVGLLAGVLLALISHFFAVPEDETAKKLRECLPSINCGACGYKGCDDYAAALAEGKAQANLCVPGAASVANELGAILGIEVEPPKDVVAYVHCNGNCEATSKKASYEGISTCFAAAQLYGGEGACRFGCLGFGSCVSVCPQNAIGRDLYEGRHCSRGHLQVYRLRTLRVDLSQARDLYGAAGNCRYRNVQQPR